jgi:hypothetical protein
MDVWESMERGRCDQQKWRMNVGILHRQRTINRKHKKIHQVTFESPSRQVASITDYMTYTETLRYAIQDMRVYTSAELSTEHRLLIMKIKIKVLHTQKNRKNYEKIKVEELEKEETRRRYRERLRKIWN